VQAGYFEYPSPSFPHDCVEAVWSFRPHEPAEYMVLPDGRVDLLVRFQIEPGDAISNIRTIIAGPARRACFVPATPHTGFLGVRFRPGWGAACLGLNPKELCEATLLDDEVRAALGTLAYPLVQAKEVSELQQVLLKTAYMLVSGIRPDRRFARAVTAVKFLHGCDGKCSVETLAQMVNVSTRTLHRDIATMTGLCAKSLSALFRFQHAMRILRITPSYKLALLATEAGYSDQSHMTREFRQFGGFTPGLRPDVVVINV
jgi:AraC-like DNA-binding protein